MDNTEKVIFTNSFGTVTDKRVIVNCKNGSEDIPFKQISSVSFERKQSITLAVFYFIVALGLLVGIFALPRIPAAFVIVVIFLFLFFILIGIAFYVGNHQIKIGAGGNDRKPIKVEMAKTNEGREFSAAIRRQLISN